MHHFKVNISKFPGGGPPDPLRRENMPPLGPTPFSASRIKKLTYSVFTNFAEWFSLNSSKTTELAVRVLARIYGYDNIYGKTIPQN